MSTRSSHDERKTQYKKGVSVEDGRRRRQDTTVQIRKSKRQEQMKKRRNMNMNAQSDVTSNGSSGSESGGQNANPKNEKNKVAKQICFKVFGNLECHIKNLNQIAQAVKSSDFHAKYAGIRYVRKLLSVQNDPPVEPILNAGLVPFLIEAIQQQQMIEMVFEAAWALTNIASTQYTNIIVESGACQPMINLLCSYNAEVREQAAWCLGNVAGDCTQYRDMLLENDNALKNIVLNLKEPGNISLLRNVTWCLSNFCRGKPQPCLAKVKPAIPVLLHLIQNSNDMEVMTDALWAMSYLSDGDDDRINACVEANVTPTVVANLSHAEVKIVTPALRVVGNLVSGNEHATQTVLEAGALPALHGLLDHPKKGIRKEACWAISNITAGTAEQIETVLSFSSIMKKIVELAEHANWDVRKEAAYALCNLPTGISDSSILKLMEYYPNTMNAYISLLDVKDVRIVKIALEAVEKTLCAATSTGTTDMADRFEELGGLNAVEELQEHQDEEVYEKTVKILEEHFGAEEVDDSENQAPQVAASGKEFAFGNGMSGGFIGGDDVPSAPSVQFNFGTPTRAY